MRTGFCGRPGGSGSVCPLSAEVTLPAPPKFVAHAATRPDAAATTPRRQAARAHRRARCTHRGRPECAISAAPCSRHEWIVTREAP